MELKEIKLENPIIKLSFADIELRLLSLEDEIWIANNFPSEEDLSKIFGKDGDPSTIDYNAVLKVVFHQIKDKGLFKTKEFKEVDEHGEEFINKVGGIALLKRQLIGQSDTEKLFAGLADVFTRSRPIPSGKKKVQ